MRIIISDVGELTFQDIVVALAKEFEIETLRGLEESYFFVKGRKPAEVKP